MPEREPHFEEEPIKLEKEIKWEKAEQNLEKYGGIEEGIKEAVAGLNVFGIETVNSCEGHHNHGRIAPWVSIEKWESKPRERYAGQKEFEQGVYERLGVVELNKNYFDYLKEHDEKAAEFLPDGQVEFDKLSESGRKKLAEMDKEIEKKYSITPEITKKWMDAGTQVDKEVENAGKDGRLQETEEYKKWKAENNVMKDNAQQLLNEFYKGRKISESNRIIIDQDGTGSWCIHNGGEDYYDVTRKKDDILNPDKKHYQKILNGKNPKKEQGELKARVALCQIEFKDFAAFLKEKYFRK